MPRMVTCLKLLQYLSVFKSTILNSIVGKRITCSGKQLHTVLVNCLFNSFTEVNLLAYENLIKLQNLNGASKDRVILVPAGDKNYINELRTSTTITMVTGYSLLIKYRNWI